MQLKLHTKLHSPKIHLIDSCNTMFIKRVAGCHNEMLFLKILLPSANMGGFPRTESTNHIYFQLNYTFSINTSGNIGRLVAIFADQRWSRIATGGPNRLIAISKRATCAVTSTTRRQGCI